MPKPKISRYHPQLEKEVEELGVDIEEARELAHREHISILDAGLKLALP